MSAQITTLSHVMFDMDKWNLRYLEIIFHGLNLLSPLLVQKVEQITDSEDRRRTMSDKVLTIGGKSLSAAWFRPATSDEVNQSAKSAL